MNFNGYISNTAIVGKFEQAIMQTASNGSFTYTLTETYTNPPAVAVMPLAVNVNAGVVSLANSLNVTLTGTLNATTVSGFVTGVASINVALGINVNAIVALTAPVTIEIMVAGA